MAEDPNPTLAPRMLDYSRRPRLAWLSRHRGKLILLALLLACAIPIYRNWTSIHAHFLWLHRSRQAANHQMPGPIRLLVTDPTEAGQLLATNPDYVRGEFNSAMYVPQVHRRLSEVDPRLLPAQELGAIVFIGPLQRPDGKRRLVILHGALCSADTLLSDTHLFVLPTPGLFSLKGPPPKITMIVMIPGTSLYAAAELRGGVVDPADPTHLVIEFVVAHLKKFSGAEEEQARSRGELDTLPNEIKPLADDQIAFKGTIDAWLQDDDSLKLKVRDSEELQRHGYNAATMIRPVLPNAEHLRETKTAARP